MSGKEKYLTIKEFSSYAKVSTQAIQQRTETSLKPYTKKVNGKKLIKASALKEFYGIEILENQDIEILSNDLQNSEDLQGKEQGKQDQEQQTRVENNTKTSDDKGQKQENQQGNIELELKVKYLEQMLENKQKELDREIENNKFLKEQFASLRENYQVSLDILKTTQVKMIVDQEQQEPGEPQEPGKKKSFLERLLNK